MDELAKFKGIVKCKYKVEEIVWLDAQSGFSIPLTIDELREEEPLWTKSVGYVLDEDKNRIILGFMLFGREGIKHWQLIPKGMIKERKVLKHGKGNRKENI